MKVVSLCLMMFTLAGCSVFGNSGVETAPYTVIEKAENQKIELRNYESLILASTPMIEGMEEGRNPAFRRLFNYITGENTSSQKVSMTAPVIMNEEQEDNSKGEEISMTAPVFMDDKDEGAMMSFVLPKEYTMQSAPIPTNDQVKLQEIKDYTVAAITFSGRLTQGNIDENKVRLEQWIQEKGYAQTGNYKAAGYNAPWTLPFLRRNEVLIPIKMQ